MTSDCMYLHGAASHGVCTCEQCKLPGWCKDATAIARGIRNSRPNCTFIFEQAVFASEKTCILRTCSGVDMVTLLLPC
jgi:hypothetical protein